MQFGAGISVRDRASQPLQPCCEAWSKGRDTAVSQDWAEIEWCVAEVGERSADLPPDTQGVSYRVRTRGMAESPTFGTVTEIVTPTGRRQVGTVVAIRPGYTHSFGTPLPEWVRMREAIRTLLADYHFRRGEP